MGNLFFFVGALFSLFVASSAGETLKKKKSQTSNNLVTHAFSLETKSSDIDSFKVVAYVPEYRLPAISWEAAGPLLSHAILFSLEMDAGIFLLIFLFLPFPFLTLFVRRRIGCNRSTPRY